MTKEIGKKKFKKTKYKKEKRSGCLKKSGIATNTFKIDMLKFDKNMMYREVILEHSKRPQNFETVEGLKIYHSKNPFCGDHISLQVEFDDESKIKNIYHKSKGCSISIASVSILTDLLKNKSVPEAIYISENFLRMIKGLPFDKNIDFKDGVVFKNIKNYPARQTCATIGWQLLIEALKDSKGE